MTAPRRVWVLVPQPGREVMQVWDSFGEPWNRYINDLAQSEAIDAWSAPDDPDLRLSWSQLLVEWGPLSDQPPAGV